MSLKKDICNGKLVLGSWITIGHPAIAEIMAKAGFDWLAIDMEHAPISIAQCQELIRTIDLCGVTPLVRVAQNNAVFIKQALDAGAAGVIVPMVNSKEEAEAAVRAAKYSPEGYRGVGLARAQGYCTDFEKYKKYADEETIVIVQIEDIKAVNDLESIFKVKGVDAFIVGPYDLSGSLGVPGEFEQQGVRDALEKIKRVSKDMNMTAGYHVVTSDAEKVREKIQEGYTFIAYGVDFLFLGENIAKGLNFLKK